MAEPKMSTAAIPFPASSLLSVDREPLFLRSSVLETPSIYKAFRYFSLTLPGTKSVFYNCVMNEYMTKQANIQPRSKSSKESHCLEDKVHNVLWSQGPNRVCAHPVFCPASQWFPPSNFRLLQLLSEILKASPASWRQWEGMKRWEGARPLTSPV